MASVTGSADSFYHRQWEDHWWLEPESWASGGTYQNSTYDDYHYQYQWTKTWQGQGEPEVSSSASNHVTGLENGSATGWWTHTDGQGNSSSTSGGGPWSDSYDETVNDSGFYEGAYYGWDYGGGREEYFAYLGDAFYENPGSDSGFFPFAYRRAEPLFGQAQGRNQEVASAGAELHVAREIQGLTHGERRLARSPDVCFLPSWRGLGRTPSVGETYPTPTPKGGKSDSVLVMAEAEGGGEETGGFKLFGEEWVWPWSEEAARFWDTLGAYGRAAGRAAVGTASGALAGAGTGALAGGATGFAVTGGPGVLPGAGAGAVGGAIWGGVSGLARAAFARDAKDAAIGGAEAGAVGGAVGGVVRAYGAVRALGTSSKLVASAKDLADPNKIHHVFGQSKHLLESLVAKYGSEAAAYKALQDVVVRELARRGTTAKEFSEKGIEVLFEGHRVIVRGTIIDKEVRMGAAFVPRPSP